MLVHRNNASSFVGRGLGYDNSMSNLNICGAELGLFIVLISVRVSLETIKIGVFIHI